MNLLAHAFLANADPERIVGQLCGDFVRGSNLDAYPGPIQAGIRCHRAVDSYTDQHLVNLTARNLFESPHRRFAGIAVDIIYDYFLANSWARYSTVSLREYTELVDRALQKHHQKLPAGLQRFAGLLASEGTLYRNLDRDHIDLTLYRISKRHKSFTPLASIAPLMWQQEAALRDAFDRFFPELVSYTLEYQKEDGIRG